MHNDSIRSMRGDPAWFAGIEKKNNYTCLSHSAMLFWCDEKVKLHICTRLLQIANCQQKPQEMCGRTWSSVKL